MNLSRGFEVCSTSIKDDNEFNKHSKDKMFAHRKVDLDLSSLSDECVRNCCAIKVSSGKMAVWSRVVFCDYKIEYF